jgi:c-di-GMP-binding flagellar brake protein YcgR
MAFGYETSTQNVQLKKNTMFIIPFLGSNHQYSFNIDELNKHQPDYMGICPLNEGDKKWHACF